MPSTQDLRRRIRAVKNMQQVTRAMRMVAAARLRRAQERVVAARPYAKKMVDLLASLTGRASGDAHPLLRVKEGGRALLVLITADKGLCGAFNTNLVRAAQVFLREHASSEVELVAIGRKGRDFFRRQNVPIRAEYINVTARRVEFSQAQEIAGVLMEAFLDAEQNIRSVTMIYNEFKSVASQRVVVDRLLPLSSVPAEASTDVAPRVLIDYLYEQTPAEILGSLLPRFVETQVYRALLESAASEHGARMMAMESATNNAKEVIETLTLNMNRVRQASITRQIIEIVSGAAALEEA
ncbi:MAG: ATP synthase F1 subunit gamma [Acidobacteria bacterium]|nr:ATP synthase F1 subunit gamma [Acidobacteriota bacterium]